MNRELEIRTNLGKGTITKAEYEELVELIGHPVDWAPNHRHGQELGNAGTPDGSNQIPARRTSTP